MNRKHFIALLGVIAFCAMASMWLKQPPTHDQKLCAVATENRELAEQLLAEALDVQHSTSREDVFKMAVATENYAQTEIAEANRQIKQWCEVQDVKAR